VLEKLKAAAAMDARAGDGSAGFFLFPAFLAAAGTAVAGIFGNLGSSFSFSFFGRFVSSSPLCSAGVVVI
jgi:hypothetical protein